MVVVEDIWGIRQILCISLTIQYLSHNKKKLLVFYPGSSDIFWYCLWIYRTYLRGAVLVRDHIFTSIADEEKKPELLLNCKILLWFSFFKY